MPNGLKIMLKNKDLLSPAQYLQLTDQEKCNFSQLEIIPPKLGQKHFGKIKVTYRYPIYKFKSF